MIIKLFKISLIVSSSALFFAGCGPQELNDMNNAQDLQGAEGQGGEGCPVGGSCPGGNCEIAPDADTHRQVQKPDIVRTEPTKITPTAEKQIATDVVDYHTTEHVIQPHERHHTVNKHRHLLNRHFHKRVYHPTTRRINSVVTSFSQEDQVMPTEEIVAPVVDYGCSNAVPAPVVQTAIVPVVYYYYLQPYLAFMY